MSMTVNFLLPVDVGWNHVMRQSEFDYFSLHFIATSLCPRLDSSSIRLPA